MKVETYHENVGNVCRGVKRNFEFESEEEVQEVMECMANMGRKRDAGWDDYLQAVVTVIRMVRGNACSFGVFMEQLYQVESFIARGLCDSHELLVLLSCVAVVELCERCGPVFASIAYRVVQNLARTECQSVKVLRMVADGPDSDAIALIMLVIVSGWSSKIIKDNFELIEDTLRRLIKCSVPRARRLAQSAILRLAVLAPDECDRLVRTGMEMRLTGLVREFQECSDKEEVICEIREELEVESWARFDQVLPDLARLVMSEASVAILSFIDEAARYFLQWEIVDMIIPLLSEPDPFIWLLNRKISASKMELKARLPEIMNGLKPHLSHRIARIRKNATLSIVNIWNILDDDMQEEIYKLPADKQRLVCYFHDRRSRSSSINM